MSTIDLIQVYFLKTPTAKPFSLAYSKGQMGFVTASMADKLLAAGMISPPLAATPYLTKAEIDSSKKKVEKVSTDTVKKAKTETLEIPKTYDLTTRDGVAAKFGVDVKAMKAYCDEHKITYHVGVKRPETLYAKIANFNKNV